jgi:hypothetical protein
MSVDVIVYSPDNNPVDVRSLAETAAAAGWNVCVLREWDNWSNYQIITDGPLLSGDELCGWPRKDPRAPGVAEALSKRLDKVIERFFLNDAIGACGLCLSSPDEFFFSGLSEAEREAVRKRNSPDEYRATFLEGVFDPKLIYTLNASASPGKVYGEFFEQIGQWIARICGGAWEDPQSDTQEVYA